MWNAELHVCPSYRAVELAGLACRVPVVVPDPGFTAIWRVF